MELLRTLVQPLIDADVAAVMRKYVDAYFRPAAYNARKNLGRHSRTFPCSDLYFILEPIYKERLGPLQIESFLKAQIQERQSTLICWKWKVEVLT